MRLNLITAPAYALTKQSFPDNDRANIALKISGLRKEVVGKFLIRIKMVMTFYLSTDTSDSPRVLWLSYIILSSCLTLLNSFAKQQVCSIILSTRYKQEISNIFSISDGLSVTTLKMFCFNHLYQSRCFRNEIQLLRKIFKHTQLFTRK